MAGRPKTTRSNIKALKQLKKLENSIVSLRPVVAYILVDGFDCTHQEVADVFDVTRQQALNYYNKAKKELGGE